MIEYLHDSDAVLLAEQHLQAREADRHWKRVYRVRVLKWYVPITVSLFVGPFNCSQSGLWPFNLWFRRWRVSFHWLKVADAYIQIGWKR